MNRYFTKKHKKMANKHIKIFSSSLNIRKMQIRPHCELLLLSNYLLQWFKLKKQTDNAKSWWRCREYGTLIICWWEQIVISSLENNLAIYSQVKPIFITYDQAISLLGFYIREVKTYVYTESLYANFYSCLIHNYQKLETVQMSHGWINYGISIQLGFPGGSVVKNPSANAGDAEDVGSIPGLGRFPGEGNGNPLQYSCLKNPMDREAW